MKADWHDLIYRYVEGRASDEENAAIQQALKDDPDLRALYLDYMNLEMSLEAAGAALVASELPRVAPMAKPPCVSWWRLAMAAGRAILVGGALLLHHRPAPARDDVAATIASAKSAVARLPEPPSIAFPAWMSPTASILDEPNSAP